MSVGDALLRDSKRDPHTGCLRWQGTIDRDGYGRRGRYLVHRVAYESFIGPIPEAMEIDHVYERGCRYRDCLEPTHLEAVTHQENTARFKRRITHCPKGHEYTPENTYMYRGKRNCRECNREAVRRYAERRKQA